MLLASTGRPILQSRSPDIFNSAFSKLGMEARYIRLAAWDASDAVRTAQEMNIIAFNVTSPFKEQMLGLMDGLDKEAEKIGAVNTVSLKGGKLTGHNTDYFGAEAALAHALGPLKGKRAVVLGAGGAAKAAIYALVSAGVLTTVINRTDEKAEKLARQFGCACAPIKLAAKTIRGADILVSCIPTCDRVVPASALSPKLAVLDADYGQKTCLSADAKEAGCKIIDGREWLLYQAVPRFEFITGKEPPIEEMRKALYAKRNGKKPNIALIGFMGSGKSTVGKILARSLNYGFVDLDREIELKKGKTVAEIFANEGEREFRRLERDEVSKMEGAGGKVFSCGGGAILEESSRKTIRSNCIAIWLWASPQTAVGRLGKDSARRPLLEKGEGTPAEKAARIIAGRMPLYAETCDMAISTENRTPEQVAERIIYEIDNAFAN